MPAVDTSDMYMGTIMVSIPTARPATARPPKRTPVVLAAAWRAEPRTKTTTAANIDPFRPNRSAIGPLMSDPNHAANSSVDTNQPLKLLSV